MTLSEFLELFRAAAPLLAACIAGLVAYKFGSIQASISRQQAATATTAAQTAKNKLKLDLFEKRLAIYTVASDAIAEVIQGGNFLSEDYHSYYASIQGAKWLFGDEVYNYLDTGLGVQLKKVCELDSKLEHATDERRTVLGMERLDCAVDLGLEIPKLTETFKKYLRIEG